MTESMEIWKCSCWSCGHSWSSDFCDHMDCPQCGSYNSRVAVTEQAARPATLIPKQEEKRTTHDSGGAKGVKQARFDQIPSDVLYELAEHYGKGNEKYPAVNGLDNWRNGYEYSKSFAACQRHMHAFWLGEDIDPETGSSHLIAAMWHMAAMRHWQKTGAGVDDRQSLREYPFTNEVVD